MGEINSKTDDVIIDHKVPYIFQKYSHSCWYACAEMLYGYHHPAEAAKGGFRARMRDGKAYTESGQKIQDIVTNDRGASEKDWPLLIETFGMEEITLRDAGQVRSMVSIADDVGVQKTIFRKLHVLLDLYGPIWAAGRFYRMDQKSMEGHVILLKGLLERGAGQVPGHIIFHDPGKTTNGGPDCVETIDWFSQRLYHTGSGSLGTEGHSPLMYIP
ncbi:papain-like cysteine protease family protein [Aquisphaera insulae]|uniref:papain-like cysteine protease family protein n=1 Tax=Aquisphaera insulae TaxID=2712864 RepID=UPI0013EAA00F|nr:papain-like cysteine protease family protein [Aquisphaera insulae]